MSNETPESKACRRYAERAAAVDAATRGIGEALNQCRLIRNTGSSHRGTNVPVTHLEVAYSIPVCIGTPERNRRAANDEEVEFFLSTDGLNFHDEETFGGKFDMSKIESLECPHCLEAHRLIQKRKDMRVLFGAAKRAVRAVGKRINRNMEGE